MKNRLLSTFLFWIVFIGATYANKIQTGLYLIFADKYDLYGQVNFNTTKLDPEMEFCIDLGEGYYGLKVDPSKIGFDPSNPQIIRALFKAYNQKTNKLSPFSSKWIDEANGMRLYYLPNSRFEKELFFVVNSKTLEVNYNGTFGLVGTFDVYGEVIKEPMYQSSKEDNAYIEELNKKEGIYLYRRNNKTGHSPTGVLRDVFMGMIHDNDDVYTLFPGQRNNAEIRIFNNLFGLPKNSEKEIPMRFAFNFHRLRFSVFCETHEYYLDGIEQDKFTLQGDKMILYKEFNAGTHNVTVSTPSFDMPSCNPTIFTINKSGLVKLWFYADLNPNFDNNLHIEENVLSLAEEFPNIHFTPDHEKPYFIQAYNPTEETSQYITLQEDGLLKMESITNPSNGLAVENIRSRFIFITKFFKPGPELAKHSMNALAITNEQRWDKLNGTDRIISYSNADKGIQEEPFPYGTASSADFKNKTFFIQKEATVNEIDYYTIKNSSGDLLTNNTTTIPTFQASNAKFENQLWRIIGAEDLGNITGGDKIGNMHIKIYAQNKSIIAEGNISGETITIYDATGIKHSQEICPGRYFSKELASGIYLITIKDKTQKIIIE